MKCPCRMVEYYTVNGKVYTQPEFRSFVRGIFPNGRIYATKFEENHFSILRLR